MISVNPVDPRLVKYKTIRKSTLCLNPDLNPGLLYRHILTRLVIKIPPLELLGTERNVGQLGAGPPRAPGTPECPSEQGPG